MTIYFKPLTEQAEWEWIWERAHPLQCKDTQGLVAHDEKGIIQAIVIYDSWTPDSCQVHFAIDNPMVIRRGFLNEGFGHAFNTCGRKRIFGLIPANNDRAHKLDLHIGFREVARIPHGYSQDVDYIVVGMEKEDCRWLDNPQTDADHVKALRQQRAA
jgi:hypothetical protein